MIHCVTTLTVTVNGKMMDVLVNGLQANVLGLLTGSAVSKVRSVDYVLQLKEILCFNLHIALCDIACQNQAFVTEMKC